MDILNQIVAGMTKEDMRLYKLYAARISVPEPRKDIVLFDYVRRSGEQYDDEKIFTKENHELKLLMLQYVVNALFKNKKYEGSLQYAETLHSAMCEYNKLLYDKFLFLYYNSLVINYSVLDKDKAIAVLEDILAKKTLKNTPFYELFVYLNLAVLRFEKSDCHASIRSLNKLYLHANYKNADPTLKLKIAVSELIIRYELQDFDFLEHRIGQVNKEYRDLLQKPEHNREKEFIGIMKDMIFSEGTGKKEKLQSRVKQFLAHKEERSEDAEIISYHDWLRRKMGADKILQT